jgi:hypothetical protein
VRTLESLYWYGTRLLGLSTASASDGNSSQLSIDVSDTSSCAINQWDAYAAIDNAGIDGLPTAQESLSAIAQNAENNGDHHVSGVTRLLIVPGYPFQM